MKKVFYFIFFALLLAPFAFADGEFATAGELWQYWMAQQTDYLENPYPEYVCGAWSVDGSMENLCFAVTEGEAGDAGKAEILALVEDDTTVSFETRKYSYGELLNVRREIEAQFGDDNGMNGIGIDESENTVYITIGEVNEQAENFMRGCFEKYGDMVVFETGVAIDVTAAEEIGITGPLMQEMPLKTANWLWLLPILIFFCTGSFLLIRKAKAPAKQTNTGPVSSPLTLRQTEISVRQAAISPPASLDRDIL